METNKNLIMELLAVGLCLGLLWGVSPLMAASSSQTEKQNKTNIPRAAKSPAMQHYVQPSTKTKMAAPNLNKFKSLTAQPSNSGIYKVTPNGPMIINGYDMKLSDNLKKVYRTDAGGGRAKINIGDPVSLNSKLLQPTFVPKAILAKQAYEAKMKAQQDAWNKGGGYGGNQGNGVVPPGPERVPGSTPPPNQQGNKSTGNPLLDCLAAGGALGCFR